MGMVCGARGVGGAWDVDAILLFILLVGTVIVMTVKLVRKETGEFGAVFR